MHTVGEHHRDAAHWIWIFQICPRNRLLTYTIPLGWMMGAAPIASPELNARFGAMLKLPVRGEYSNRLPHPEVSPVDCRMRPFAATTGAAVAGKVMGWLPPSLPSNCLQGAAQRTVNMSEHAPRTHSVLGAQPRRREATHTHSEARDDEPLLINTPHRL